MGYIYDAATGQLCCDECYAHGGVRKVKCTYGYCPASALCAHCRKSPAVKARANAYHEEFCKPASERFAASQERKQKKLDNGFHVNTSNAGNKDGTVTMTFTSDSGHKKELVVSKAVYGTKGEHATYHEMVGKARRMSRESRALQSRCASDS